MSLYFNYFLKVNYACLFSQKLKVKNILPLDVPMALIEKFCCVGESIKIINKTSFEYKGMNFE